MARAPSKPRRLRAPLYALPVIARAVEALRRLVPEAKIGVANGLMGLYPARGSVRKHGQPLALRLARGAGALDQ